MTGIKGCMTTVKILMLLVSLATRLGGHLSPDPVLQAVNQQQLLGDDANLVKGVRLLPVAPKPS